MSCKDGRQEVTKATCLMRLLANDSVSQYHTMITEQVEQCVIYQFIPKVQTRQLCPLYLIIVQKRPDFPFDNQF